VLSVHCSWSLNSDVKGSAPVATEPRGYAAAAPPGITFDRFVRACVVVKQLTESFAKLDTDHDGWVQVNYEKFMETVLTLP
jgi:peflin